MRKNRVAGLALLALLLAGCQADQATKGWAIAEVKGSPLTVIPGLVELRYAENRAIAFSMLKDIPDSVREPLIFAMAGGVLLFMSGLAWSRRKRGMWALMPFALVLGGAFGNLIDRFRHGFVVDFVRLHWREAWSWPIFNLADSLICVGTALLFWQFLREGATESPDGPPSAQAG